MLKDFLRATLLMCPFILTGCQQNAKTPAEYAYTKDSLRIYPDYKNIVIPPNIAPLNFQIENEAEEYIVEIKSGDKTYVTGSESQEIYMDPKEWKELIKMEHGKGITFHIFGRKGDKWVRFPDFKMQVATEKIDPYLSYRLIEPGYELYRQVGLYQRNLEDFTVKVIYENNRTQDTDNNHCVNCHNYQNYGTENMLFHVRGAHGGTIIASGEEIKKMNLKNDSILGPAVYPTWHPNKKRIVFSTNLTGQSFHMNHPEKVEVMDGQSDLVFYNHETGEIRNILKTATDLETFPCWNPKGDKLYYCVASIPELSELNGDENQIYNYFLQHYNEVKYNIMSMDYDEEADTFSKPQLVVDCVAMNQSASVPRISPDAKYLLFTLGDYGQFHIWHKSADLWVKDLEKGNIYPLKSANSPDVDSYHSWSSNGRWIAFSSRRDDGNYTRVYLAYFDKEGKAHKAFMIPQEKPSHNTYLLKSYNVPELSKEAIKWSENDFREVIYNQKPSNAEFKR